MKSTKTEDLISEHCPNCNRQSPHEPITCDVCQKEICSNCSVRVFFNSPQTDKILRSYCEDCGSDLVIIYPEGK